MKASKMLGINEEETCTADLLLTHFNQVFCPNDLGHPLFGAEMREARVLKIWLHCSQDGKILGQQREIRC